MAPVVLSLALLCVGCKTGKNATTPLPSESPATSASAAPSATDFQLVGTAVHAFVGVGPAIDVSGSSTTEASPNPTQATSATFGNPTDRGVMRVRLDDASDSLKSSCGAARDETAIVYWTTSTQFDTSLLASDLESALEGRTVGVVGRLFTSSSSQSSGQIGETSPSPSASPAAAINSECVLVADQVGTSTGTALPTPRASVTTRRTATPTVAPTAAPTVKTTVPPTVSPVVTTSPSPVPTAT